MNKKIKRNKLGFITSTGKYGDGTIHINNKGERFKILGRCEEDYKYRWAQFFEHPMQYIGKYQINHIYEGQIRNPYYLSIYEVACIGEKYYTSHPLFKPWENTISRCYNPKSKNYKNYGAAGVRVHSDWHNFSNFVDDMMYSYIPKAELIEQARMLGLKVDLQIDKDLKSEGKGLLYSKNTVKIVTSKENNDEMFERKRKEKVKN